MGAESKFRLNEDGGAAEWLLDEWFFDFVLLSALSSSSSNARSTFFASSSKSDIARRMSAEVKSPPSSKMSWFDIADSEVWVDDLKELEENFTGDEEPLAAVR